MSENIALAAAQSAAASASSAATSAEHAASIIAEPNDAAVSTLVNTPASSTAVALSATIATEVEADTASPTGVILDRTTRTSFYDDFTTKPNGALLAGAVSDSGHTYTVLGQVPWEIVGGRLTNTITNTATVQSSYLGVNLGLDADDTIGYIWADFEVPAGADPATSLVLIASETDFAGAPAYEFSDAAAHCTFDPAAFRYDSLEATHPGLTTTVLGRGQYATLAAGTYRAEVAIDGTRATITDPTGKKWRADPSAFVSDRNGPWATLQLYGAGGGVTRKELQVLRWGAELERRAKRGSYASASEVARAATVPGRLAGAMQTSGASTATAITTSLSAKLYGLTIPIPPSRRVLVEGTAWFDQSVPLTQATSVLMVGVYPGGSGTYGKLMTIYSGRTPANGSEDETGNAANESYANGRLFPFALILTLDPAFQIGDPIDFQVKAQAGAASQWTFIDSGNASGGASSIRYSTLKITELAPA